MTTVQYALQTDAAALMIPLICGAVWVLCMPLLLIRMSARVEKIVDRSYGIAAIGILLGTPLFGWYQEYGLAHSRPLNEVAVLSRVIHPGETLHGFVALGTNWIVSGNARSPAISAVRPLPFVDGGLVYLVKAAARKALSGDYRGLYRMERFRGVLETPYPAFAQNWYRMRAGFPVVTHLPGTVTAPAVVLGKDSIITRKLLGGVPPGAGPKAFRLYRQAPVKLQKGIPLMRIYRFQPVPWWDAPLLPLYSQ